MNQVLRRLRQTIINLKINIFVWLAGDDSSKEVVGSKCTENKTEERGPAFCLVCWLLSLPIDRNIDQKPRLRGLRINPLE